MTRPRGRNTTTTTTTPFTHLSYTTHPLSSSSFLITSFSFCSEKEMNWSRAFLFTWEYFFNSIFAVSSFLNSCLVGKFWNVLKEIVVNFSYWQYATSKQIVVAEQSVRKYYILVRFKCRYGPTCCKWQYRYLKEQRVGKILRSVPVYYILDLPMGSII